MSLGMLGIIALGLLITPDPITGQGCIVKPVNVKAVSGNWKENGRPPPGTECVEVDNKVCHIQSGRWGKTWCYTDSNKNNWGAECVLTSGNDYLDAMKAAYKSLDIKDVNQLCMYWMTVVNYLPKLMAANKMEAGDVGIDDGSTHKTNKKWVKTLSLLTGDDIVTKHTDNQLITINGTVNGYIGKRWYGSMKDRPTGLYAGPGDIVTITIPQRLVGKIKAVTGHDKFKLNFPLKKKVNQIGSPWGGHIIIYLKDKTATKGEFEIKVNNALKAPVFIFGKDNNEDWNTEIKKYSPKWALLRVPGQLDVYVQTLKIKDITDMEGTVAEFKSTMDLLEDMLGLPPNSQPGAEVLNFRPGMGGGNHYGVCKPGTANAGDTLYAQGKKNNYKYYDDFFHKTGTNGLVLHEFGHGFCYGDLPDMGNQWTAETVRDYIEVKKGVYPAGGKDMDFSLLSRMVGFALHSNGKACGKAKFKFIQLKTSSYDKCERWLNYIPIKEFGWDTLKQVFSQDAVSKEKYTSQWDRMVDLYCKATKHNLIPLFNFYNIKVSNNKVSTKVTESCKKQPKPVVITELLKIANCVKDSMESEGKKDMKDCAKLPRFPEHKGLCLLSGVCHNDKAYGKKMKWTNKFDLYGSTGKWLSKKDTTNNKENCLKQAIATFGSCGNDVKQKNHMMTATFHAKESGQDASYTYPPAAQDGSPVRCLGVDNGCCTVENPCDENDGDCDNHNQCKGDLVCGKNNCLWGDGDDCCKKT